MPTSKGATMKKLTPCDRNTLAQILSIIVGKPVVPHNVLVSKDGELITIQVKEKKP
jgi:hypothetical protein